MPDGPNKLREALLNSPQAKTGLVGAGDPETPVTPGRLGVVSMISGLPRAALEAAKLPGDVYAGRVNPGSQEGIERAADLAGFVGLGGTAVPRPAGSIGTFGGPTAKTADLDALKRAEAMDMAGQGRQEIWDATGWFKGPDGQWRFEIDDSSANVNLSPEFEGTRVQANTVGMATEHPALFEAYPDLPGMGLSRGSPPKGGYYSPERNKVDVGPYTPSRDRSVMLHELQHAIQEREGFAPGGNRQVAADIQGNTQQVVAGIDQKMDDLARRIDAAHARGDEAAAQRLMDDFSTLMGGKMRLEQYAKQGSKDIYRGLAGEVEARNVETRADMTPEQRRATPPWKTEDTPRRNQLARRRGRVSGLGY